MRLVVPRRGRLFDNGRLGSGWNRRQHLLFPVNQSGGVIARDLKSVAVCNRICRARFHAVTAKNTAIVIDVVYLGVTFAAGVYTSMFGSYNKTWGSLAAVIIMLTWLWLTGLALLFGAELNAEVERSRELRQGKPAEVELQAPGKA